MTAQSANHYEALGIARNATPDDIKRAWARGVREHPPDSDPNGNMKVNEARRVLLDPAARTEYDAMLDFGDEIAELRARASELEEAEDYAAAARCYKEILAYHPASSAARHAMAGCLYGAGDYDGAVSTLKHLVERVPGSPLYWSSYGDALEACARDGQGGPAMLVEAQQAYERAAELEPHNALHYIELSRHWRRREDYVRAEQYIERAVNADGAVDIHDLEALFELPVIHVFAGQLDRLDRDASRIHAAVGDADPEALEYCAYRFAGLGSDLSDVRAYAEAARFVSIARKFDPQNEKLKEFAGHMRRLATLVSDVRRIHEDSQVIEPVQAMAYLLNTVLLEDVEEDEQDRRWKHTGKALAAANPSDILRSLDRLIARYPVLYADDRSTYDELRKDVNAVLSSRPTPPTPTGCVVPVVALLVAVVVEVLRMLG